MNRMVLIVVRVVAFVLTIALWCWVLGCTLSFVSSRLSRASPLRPRSPFRRMSQAHRPRDEAEDDQAEGRVPCPRIRGHVQPCSEACLHERRHGTQGASACVLE